MAKNMNPTKVITGKDTRWSYCNVWDAKIDQRAARPSTPFP